MKILRALISVFISIEMLFSSLGTGAHLSVKMPGKQTGEYTGYVNAFAGTGGIPWACAMLSPAACTPFGCVRVGPDTCAAGGLAKIKTNTSGYYYEHGHMLGFSLGRLSGTGARDYGMFRVCPGVNGKKPSAFAYSHKNETAYPGYYAVYLPSAAALCEMTAAAHTAVFRFTFPAGTGASLFIDCASILSGGRTENAEIGLNEDGSVTGSVTLFGTFSGRYQGLPVYLYAVPGSPCAQISNENGVLGLGFEENEVTLKAGISFVSVENAKLNLEAEAGQNDFDIVRANAVNEWEERLSSIAVDADEDVKRIFYTALYRSMIMPTDFTDVNGEYTGFDKAVHTADGYTYRTDMSLWDTFRTAHPLYTIIAPDIQRDCIESLLDMADRGGVLPRWPMGEGYSGSMFGNPANVVLTESYLKGFDFDAEKAYNYMSRCADGEIGDGDLRNEISTLNEYGYLPDDICDRYSVSKTLEYCLENDVVSRLASELGKAEDAEKFGRRAMFYKNIWNSDTAYFAPRNADGSFENVTPYATSFFDDIFGTKFFRAYCEGGARHWRWSVQHDPQGLIELFGSRERFVSELEKFMRDASPGRAALDPGNGYWIGNQHDIHTPYLFIDAGRADKAQKWVRWTLANRFSTDIDGLDGNDDGGTLSSWYVLSAIGIYPIAGTDRYYIGSPAVSGAVIKTQNGAELKITVNNQGRDNVYVKSVTVNGVKADEMYLSHSDIANGGEIVFEMSGRP